MWPRHQLLSSTRSARLLALILLAGLPATAYGIGEGTGSSPASRHNFFIGLDWSADLGISSWNNIAHPSLESITSIFTFGDRRFLPFLPIRARLSVGWFPKHPFRIGGGVEIALLEILNQDGARGFGIYAFLDGIFLIGSTPVFDPRAMLGILIPLMPTGGICLEAGVQRDGRPAIAVTLMNGGYPQ